MAYSGLEADFQGFQSPAGTKFERLEGMLFGYEDWQNDWWLEDIRKRGLSGAPRCSTWQ